MRLIGLKVSNYRCFKAETIIDLDDITVLIGQNDSGKSSLLDALNVFFEEKQTPDSDDCCVHTAESEVRITCVFDSLPEELVIDEQHPTQLENEYLLNREGNLEITRVYDCSGKGKPKGVFCHANHPTEENVCDLLSLTNPKLKQRATALSIDLSDVNETINTELRRAIWASAPDFQCQEVDVELKSEAAGKVWDQLKKYLPVFALFKSDRPSTDQDAEAQDPMKTAIKDAVKKQEDALNQIADQVKAQVQDIADRTVAKIKEMNPDLANQLTPRVTNKNWDSLFSVSLTGDEDIPINKRGSGTRRLILLNFFRAEAEKLAEDKETNVIYAIEEPETSQHPHNQILLAKALEDLADRPGCQVLLTTHTPVLARKFPQDCLRFVTSDENGLPVILSGRDEEALERIRDSLGVLPDHNIRAFLGVEGKNDIVFLKAISKMLHEAGEDVPDLQMSEDDGHLVFIPLGGSSMDLWISRFSELNLPEFYLIDRDNEPPQDPAYREVAEKLEARGCTVWTTQKKELENYIHPDVVKSAFPGYAGTGDDFENVPMLCAQAIHEASESDIAWSDVTKVKEKLAKKISGAKRQLNNNVASRMSQSQLTEIDSHNEIRSWLGVLGSALAGGGTETTATE